MRFSFIRLNPSVSSIDLIEHIERFSDRCSNRVASVDELSLVTDVFVEVIEQFLGNLDADLRHTLVFTEEYLQRVAQYTGLIRRPHHARPTALDNTEHRYQPNTRKRSQIPPTVARNPSSTSAASTTTPPVSSVFSIAFS